MDTYADDLACLIDALDLRDVTLVGFSTGGGEVARYIGRHGTGRVAQAGAGLGRPAADAAHRRQPRAALPIEVFDAIRAGAAADRSQLYRDLADGPFFGHNRPGDVSQGIRDAFWLQSMACGHRNAYECIAAFSATDFRARPRRRSTCRRWSSTATTTRSCRSRSAASAPPRWSTGATAHGLRGRAHGSPTPTSERLHADLLAFLNS